MFFKIAVLKNFANFTGSIHRSCYVSKVVLRNFVKFTLGLQRFLAQVFSCKFYEITKNIFFTEWLWAAASDLILLTISSDCFWQSQDFQPATFLKKDSGKDVFYEFCKIFKNTFWQNTSDDCFLSLSVNFEKFFRTPLLFSTSEKLQLCHVQVADFQPAGTVKNYFKGVFKVF